MYLTFTPNRDSLQIIHVGLISWSQTAEWGSAHVVLGRGNKLLQQKSILSIVNNIFLIFFHCFFIIVSLGSPMQKVRSKYPKLVELDHSICSYHKNGWYRPFRTYRGTGNKLSYFLKFCTNFFTLHTCMNLEAGYWKKVILPLPSFPPYLSYCEWDVCRDVQVCRYA